MAGGESGEVLENLGLDREILVGCFDGEVDVMKTLN
jgi:hypothetical protein